MDEKLAFHKVYVNVYGMLKEKYSVPREGE